MYYRRNVKKSRDAIKSMEADIEQAQERLVKVKDEKDKLTEEAKNVLHVLEDLSVSTHFYFEHFKFIITGS